MTFSLKFPPSAPYYQTMKKKSLSTLITGVSLLATVSATTAMPLAGGNTDFDYAIKGKELSWLSAGVWGGSVKREIEWDNGTTDVMESTPVDLYIGARIVNWFDLIGIIGSRNTDFEFAGEGDRNAEWGLGFQARLFSHQIPEVSLMVDTIRITMNATWLSAGTKVMSRSEDWSETSASLLFGLYNSTSGNKLYGPESIGIYAGPGFSALNGDNFSESESVGLIAGAQFFIVDTVGLEIQGQFFEENSVLAGISYQF
jgi:hypothetical protein